MKQSFTLAELYAHRGCYSKEMINYCARGLGIVTLDFIINHSDMKLTEKAWFISNHIDMTPAEHSAFALGCADIATTMFGVNKLLMFKQIVKAAITDDEYIDKAMRIAGSCNQTHAYAVYAACTRDPYDRIFSACNAVQLAGKFWVECIENWMKQFCIK
jgi:hypothetical protein